MEVAIISAAATPVGNIQSNPEDPVQVLEQEVLADVAIEAIGAAGIDKTTIDGLSVAQPRPYTAQKYFATFMASYLGLPSNAHVAELLGNGMTGALAFEHASDNIRSGRADVTLALGVNFESAISASKHMMSSMRAVGDVNFQSQFGITPIAWYAMDAMRYQHEHQVSREAIASVAVKNRLHASHNPRAQYRTPIDLNDVLTQPQIVHPLGLYEVPPRGDGAVCLVLAREEIARELGRPYILVRGQGFHHEGAHQITQRPNDMIALNAARKAGQQAFESAKIAAIDLDLAELYAPCTIVEVLASEALGLVPRGKGAYYAADGRTRFDGDIPISTSGGLMSRGHPAYVTPLYSFVEVYEQLLGTAGSRQVKNAELALTSAELGNYNAAMIHILERINP